MELDAEHSNVETQTETKINENNQNLDDNVIDDNKPSSNLSKSQVKKLAKRKKWQENRHILRALEKQKKKLKRQKLREEIEKGVEPPKKARKLPMKDSDCKLRVAIDLSFDDLMAPLDINKVVKQTERCYAANRRAEKPLQFYLTSFNAESKNALASKAGCLNWDVNYEEDHYTHVFKKEDIVYLTSDSPNVIEKLDETKVYIIGGLVDHNHHKGLCYNLAIKNEISHGKLPISQYLDMKTRHVLTINQVFDIVLGVANGNSWEDSFIETLPQRKGAKPKDESLTSEESQHCDQTSSKTFDAEKTFFDIMLGGANENSWEDNFTGTLPQGKSAKPKDEPLTSEDLQNCDQTGSQESKTLNTEKTTN